MLLILTPWMQIKRMVNWKIIKDKLVNKEKYLTLFQQHFTTITKLYIAKHHIEQLSKLIPNQKATDVMNIQKGKLQFTSDLMKKSITYQTEIYGFFNSLRSCIDSFFWEISYIFKLECLRASDVWDEINQKYNKTKINSLLKDLGNELWFQYLSDMRNNLAHYRLSEIATFDENLGLFLPKNPKLAFSELNSERDKAYSNEKEFEVIPHLKHLYEKTLQFLEKGYALLIDKFD